MSPRFTTSSHFDPTITQKVRNTLMESGHAELVNEILVDGMRDIESMARVGLKDHEDRIKMLENLSHDRLTETGVIKIIIARASKETQGWLKWGTRAAIGAIGGLLLTFIGWVLTLAWKGLHV